MDGRVELYQLRQRPCCQSDRHRSWLPKRPQLKHQVWGRGKNVVGIRCRWSSQHWGLGGCTGYDNVCRPALSNTHSRRQAAERHQGVPTYFELHVPTDHGQMAPAVPCRKDSDGRQEGLPPLPTRPALVSMLLASYCRLLVTRSLAHSYHVCACAHPPTRTCTSPYRAARVTDMHHLLDCATTWPRPHGIARRCRRLPTGAPSLWWPVWSVR